MAHDHKELMRPAILASRDDVLGRPSVVPAAPGVYAWYFDCAPSNLIQLDTCWSCQGRHLLYVGISPKRPPANGSRPSSQNLRSRIRYHMRGNAYGSTLRLTLGCLLADELQLQLRRVGSGTRLTFSDGEARLSDWMARHAYVTWMVHPEPWLVEADAIKGCQLPLNLDQNSSHPFHNVLSGVRHSAREKARALPVLAK